MRTTSLCLFALLSTSALWAAEADLETDLGNLWKARDYSVGRASSTAPDGGNKDYRRIAPWETATLADIDGPGMIHHIWMTIMHKDPGHLKKVVLRFYWDGEEHPSVEAPIGDFFCLGTGDVIYEVNSLPVQVGSFKGMNCFWPMPFKRHARITAENQSDIECYALFYYVDYRKGLELPEETPTFHAWYNQRYPADATQDYVILEAEGKGHYVGTNVSILLNVSGWWGEGDDKIYIDGATTPTLKGTGSEDYFGGAWCYKNEFSGPFLGAPMISGEKRFTRGSPWDVYRFHVADPITFQKSIKVQMETGADPAPGKENVRYPLRNHHASVAYWYQTEPHRPFPPLPPAPQRVPHLLPLETDAASSIKEGELMPVAASSEAGLSIRMQNLGDAWSGQLQKWLQFTQAGQWADLRFKVARAGTYRVSIVLTHAVDYGIAEIAINGRTLESKVDCFLDHATHIDKARVSLGRVQLEAGDNLLRLICSGKNPRSNGYLLGIDCLEVEN